MAKFQVWTCKIVVADNVKLPERSNYAPRKAAIMAMEDSGVRVLSCFSDWGGALTDIQRKIVENNLKGENDRRVEDA